jgi:hypothetical protein
VLVPEPDDDVAVLAVGAGAHVAISLGWGLVLAAVLPRRRTVFYAALATLGIAAVDLGLIGRRFPTVAALDPVPQVLDHLAYGVVVGAVLSRRRAR